MGIIFIKLAIVRTWQFKRRIFKTNGESEHEHHFCVPPLPLALREEGPRGKGLSNEYTSLKQMNTIRSFFPF
jgi:hypothetical protein